MHPYLNPLDPNNLRHVTQGCNSQPILKSIEIYTYNFNQIFNLRNRTEHGALHHSDGTVNALSFYVDDRHVVTASEDGNVCIVKTSTWRVEKTLVKHKVRLW